MNTTKSVIIDKAATWLRFVAARMVKFQLSASLTKHAVSFIDLARCKLKVKTYKLKTTITYLIVMPML